MNMKILIAILFSGLIVGILSAVDGGQQPVTSWIGNDAGITKSQQVVIRNPEKWKNLWSQIHSNREPMPATPTIDFSNQMIIGYFLGQRTSGGYSVSIENVSETGEKIVVAISQTSPGPGSIVSQALTSPYAIQVIPRSDKQVLFKTFLK